VARRHATALSGREPASSDRLLGHLVQTATLPGPCQQTRLHDHDLPITVTLVAKEELRSVGIEVRVCVTEAPPDEIVTVSWNPCTLGDDEGRSFEAWISWHDDVQPQPLYPFEDRPTR
jgi:hypothetical protein